MKFSVGAFSDVGRSRDTTRTPSRRRALGCSRSPTAWAATAAARSRAGPRSRRCARRSRPGTRQRRDQHGERRGDRTRGGRPRARRHGHDDDRRGPAAGRTAAHRPRRRLRAYLLHEGTLSRVTDDHSLVEELVREGRLTPEQAESHPQRTIVTRALGIDARGRGRPLHARGHAGDRVLLCSDGLTTMVRERDVERIVRSEPDPQRAAELLVDAANEAGGEDNITVIVLDVLEVDDAAPPDPDVLATEQPSATPTLDPGARRRRRPPPQPEPRPSLRSRVRGALLVVRAARVDPRHRGPRRSATTPAARTSSASTATASSSTRACPAACSAGTRRSKQAPRSPSTTSRVGCRCGRRRHGTRLARTRRQLVVQLGGNAVDDDHDHDHDVDDDPTTTSTTTTTVAAARTAATAAVPAP